jgi:hypothetical protein
MMFKRPELEKDNPIAPQPYIGPRRRRAMARAALKEFTEDHDVKKALRTLTLAASRYVHSLPKTRKPKKSLTVLRDAIAQAERALAAKDH